MNKWKIISKRIAQETKDTILQKVKNRLKHDPTVPTVPTKEELITLVREEAKEILKIEEEVEYIIRYVQCEIPFRLLNFKIIE